MLAQSVRGSKGGGGTPVVQLSKPVGTRQQAGHRLSKSRDSAERGRMVRLSGGASIVTACRLHCRRQWRLPWPGRSWKRMTPEAAASAAVSEPAPAPLVAKGAEVFDAVAELRLLLRVHMTIADGGTFPGVLMKRSYLWLKRAERLLEAALAGGPILVAGRDARPSIYAALRAAAWDLIENCDFMSHTYRHEYRKLVARLPLAGEGGHDDGMAEHLYPEGYLQRFLIVSKLPPPSRGGSEVQPDHQALAGLFRYVSLFELKVTRGCNLPCTYCNMDADKPTAQRMSMATFRDAVSLLMRHGQVPYPEVEFHGGEPLLLSDGWYQEAVATARALAEEHGKRVRFRMVTNGILLDDERIDLLKRLGIKLCLSLDGPPEINDVHRKQGALVERAIRRLQNKDVPFALLTVITDANAARMDEVIDHFGDLGLELITSCFNQPQGRGLELEELSVEHKLGAMATLMQRMAARDHRVSDTHVGRMVQRFMVARPENPGLSCSEKECLAGRNFITVDPLGDLYACATDLANHRLGNIYRGVDREHANRTLVRLHDKDAWYERCTDCAAKAICDYNCPTSQFNDPRHRDAECAYTKALYAYLDAHRETAAAVHENLQLRERAWDERKRARLKREATATRDPALKPLRRLNLINA
jgi:uncharacterized protein